MIKFQCALQKKIFKVICQRKNNAKNQSEDSLSNKQNLENALFNFLVSDEFSLRFTIFTIKLCM